jgi:hypothetical protein
LEKPKVKNFGLFILGVANLVGLATETAEISEFFLNGLSELPRHHPAGAGVWLEIGLAHPFSHSGFLQGN